jgi:hypothetical protein
MLCETYLQLLMYVASNSVIRLLWKLKTSTLQNVICKDHSRFMKHLYKQAVVTAVQNDPNLSASSICRASKKDIHIPLEYKNSVGYLV